MDAILTFQRHGNLGAKMVFIQLKVSESSIMNHDS